MFICQEAAPELITVTLSAALAGSVFGDHCSPISDTTILSSTAAGCDHIKHVSTQIPYAVTVALCCFVGYLAAGFSMGNLWLTLGNDADFPSRLNRKTFIHAGGRMGDLLQLLQALDVGFQHFPARAGPRRGERIGRLDQNPQQRIVAPVVMVRGNGLDNAGILPNRLAKSAPMAACVPSIL